MIVTEAVRARGHPNVRATHRSTLEVTRDGYLTPRGDCIIGVSADKAAADLSPSFKDLLRSGGRLIIAVVAGGVYDIIRARGSPHLTMGDTRSIVVRRSRYVDGRTVAVGSDKAAADLRRDLVDLLRRGRELSLVLVAYEGEQAREAEREVYKKLRDLTYLGP